MGSMRRFHWLYLVAAIPLAVLALSGAEYGAFWFYAAPTLVCVAQFVRPSKLGWLALTLLYGAGAGLLTWDLSQRLWRFSWRESPLFFDPEEAFGFLSVLLVSYVLLVALVAISPRSLAEERRDPGA